MLRSGTRQRSDRVVLYRAAGSGPARAAWVAGRRVGGAVARNRARRLMREAWWELGPRVREGVDLVVVARGPFEGARARDVTEEIERLLAGAGLIGR